VNSCRIIAAALTLLLGSSCAAKRVPEADTLRDVLRLSLHFQDESVESPPGGAIPAFLTLENTGLEPIDACLGDDEGYTMLGPVEALGRHGRSERPRCRTRFLLAPGGAIEIPKLLTVLDVGPGKVSTSVWIQVVDPENCGKRGCAETQIRSNPVPGLLVIDPGTLPEVADEELS